MFFSTLIFHCEWDNRNDEKAFVFCFSEAFLRKDVDLKLVGVIRGVKGKYDGQLLVVSDGLSSWWGAEAIWCWNLYDGPSNATRHFVSPLPVEVRRLEAGLIDNDPVAGCAADIRTRSAKRVYSAQLLEVAEGAGLMVRFHAGANPVSEAI